MKLTGLVHISQGLQAFGLNINKRHLSSNKSRTLCENLCVHASAIDLKHSPLTNLRVAKWAFYLFLLQSEAIIGVSWNERLSSQKTFDTEDHMEFLELS